MLERGDGPILGKGFLSNGQPLSQSLQIKRARELWEEPPCEVGVTV